jgi:hypothetical protein
MYGDSQQIKVQPILPGSIPKIVHMVWFGFKTMNFAMYLCLRSILTFHSNADQEPVLVLPLYFCII